MAIGCGVSIVVGFMFWPRGAMAALGHALSDAFVASSAYLTDAVERLTMTSRQVDTSASQQASHRAFLILDDAFRQFVAERGAKVVSLDTISRLIHRLEPAPDGRVHLGHTASPASRCRATRGRVCGDRRIGPARLVRLHSPLVPGLADMLADRRAVPRRALAARRGAPRRLAARPSTTWGRSSGDDRAQTTLQMLWADELLENQSQMQVDLLAAADLFVRGRRRGRMI